MQSLNNPYSSMIREGFYTYIYTPQKLPFVS